MKQFILSVLIFCPLFLISQSQTDPLLDMQGIEQNGNLFFQIKNYTINVVTVNKKFNDKEISKILKNYDIKNPQKKYSDENLGYENIVVENESEDKEFPSVTLFQKIYFISIGEKQIKHICFQSSLPRDTLLESAFIEVFNNKLLDSYVMYREHSTRSINFLGREIKLGATCNWMYTNNLQCSENGQMSWSVFPSVEEAENQTRLNQLKNSSRKILKQEEINIIFEGTPSVATRIVYKFNIPRMIMGGSNVLAVYYITSQVCSKYVSCVLSNYVDNKDDYTMGALLHEVMSLQD